MHLKAAVYSFLLMFWFDFEYVFAASNLISALQSLNNTDTLISSNAEFKLGFFGLTSSRNRYLGIWFNDKKDSDRVQEIIWVANRDRPVNDSSAVLRISDDGNLQVTDEQNKIYWSSNVFPNTNSTEARLLDTGNLVLVPKGSSTPIWQSFEHPTDSLLPGIMLTFDKSVNSTKTRIQSWKSSTDPSSGRFRIASLPRELPEFFIVDGDDKPYWRTGPWNGYLFLGVPYFYSEVASGFNVDDHNNTIDLSYEVANQDESFLERFVLTYDGLLVQKISNDSGINWEINFQSLETECDIYGKCGAFAVCNRLKEPICECLKGFKPRRLDEWRKGDWTNGCIRMTALQCRASGSGADRFLQLKKIKVPDFSHWIFAGPDNCQRNCLENCSCLAYSYYSGIGCMLWTTSMIDLQQFSDDGADLFVRLASSELPGESSRQKIIITVTVILSAAVAIVSVFCLWKWNRHKNGKRVTATNKEAQWQNIIGVTDRSNDFQDMPLFEFTKLVAATDNFSDVNKLGQGGFGPVYKGKCEDGQEIAVKRLSRASGQGLEEFMNEVMIISKLQHKNLVRLLGCCVEGEEKLLVYELLPNKSLDAFLFDPRMPNVLDWQKRFSIIKGISRGLLYLHRDSRLRIIHRDLKPSNILLDEELNPKISDFGMARIFGTKQYQASTLRVVGTYGYMSPEYAMEGRFSEKSDVFSFGVLLLEIVSGRRNHKILDDESLNLLTYAWKLWNENDMLSFIDPTILDQRFEWQIYKCIQVGLLCVQEYPADRPDVPALISMLDVDDEKALPVPKQPGFTRSKGGSSYYDIVANGHEDFSANNVSFTTISGR
ncbi:hypothetical protein vseg_009025 [Gypsophila vaccaria]